MLSEQDGSDHCPIVAVMDSSGLPLSLSSIPHELSSERIKQKQPKLLSFFAAASVLPRSGGDHKAEPPQESAELIAEPATKKRKLTEFFSAAKTL